MAQDGDGRASDRVAGAPEGMREVRPCISHLRADGAGAVWRAGTAGGARFATGAAYLSARAPDESMGEELSAPESSMTSENAGDPLAPEMPLTESDLAS